jgi:glucokinase
MTATTVAVDLGGTHVRAALVAADGAVLRRDRRSTPADQPTPAVVAEMISAMTGQHQPGGAPLRAVVGVPGVVDHEAEQLVHAPNLPSAWIDFLSEAWLAEATGCEVSLANDADLAAVGESAFGAGRNHRDVVYVTVSTGVGAGIVVGGRLVRGRLSGGELGHTVIDRMAAADGGPATVEDLGSGTAIGRRAEAVGLDPDGASVADAVRRGDDRAVAVWNDALSAVGVGVANLAWVVAPQVVVIGGGVGMNDELVLPIIRRQLALHGPDLKRPIEVTTADLGDDAALAGAAAWWEAVGRE